MKMGTLTYKKGTKTRDHALASIPEQEVKREATGITTTDGGGAEELSPNSKTPGSSKKISRGYTDTRLNRLW